MTLKKNPRSESNCNLTRKTNINCIFSTLYKIITNFSWSHQMVTNKAAENVIVQIWERKTPNECYTASYQNDYSLEFHKKNLVCFEYYAF